MDDLKLEDITPPIPPAVVPERRLRQPVIALQETVKNLEAKKNLPATKVHWWDRLWAWADGKKTTAGVVLSISGGIMMMFPPTWGAGWVAIGNGVALAGGSLMTTGLLHKIGKASGIGPKGEFGKKEWLELIIEIIKKIISIIEKQKK
jgi:hypothetical protein